MSKKEKFLYMANAANKTAEMAEENHFELLGAMCDEKTRQSVIMMNTENPGYMLFILNVMLINQMVEKGMTFGEASSLVIQSATAAINPTAHEHIWTQNLKEDKE